MGEMGSSHLSTASWLTPTTCFCCASLGWFQRSTTEIHFSWWIILTHTLPYPTRWKIIETYWIEKCMRVYSSVFLQNPKRVVAAHSLGGQPETQVDSGDATIHLADHHSPSQNKAFLGSPKYACRWGSSAPFCSKKSAVQTVQTSHRWWSLMVCLEDSTWIIDGWTVARGFDQP